MESYYRLLFSKLPGKNVTLKWDLNYQQKIKIYEKEYGNIPLYESSYELAMEKYSLFLMNLLEKTNKIITQYAFQILYPLFSDKLDILIKLVSSKESYIIDLPYIYNIFNSESNNPNILLYRDQINNSIISLFDPTLLNELVEKLGMSYSVGTFGFDLEVEELYETVTKYYIYYLDETNVLRKLNMLYRPDLIFILLDYVPDMNLIDREEDDIHGDI